MAYIFQLRRGWKATDAEGNIIQDDWATYEDTKYIKTNRYYADTVYYSDTNGTIANPSPTSQADIASGTYYIKNPQYVAPLAGELVLEYDNGVPRLKIGNGTDDFSALPYMSVDSFILPKPISVTLYANKWEQVVDAEGADIVDTYSQVVEVSNAIITPNSKVDLQPDTNRLCKLYDWGIALTTENKDGVVTVYAVGDVPSESFPVQATVTEIVLDLEVDEDE